MGANLFHNYYETVSVILFGIGFTTLLLHRKMIKKIIGLNIMDTAVYLFLAAKGYIDGRMAPIVTDGIVVSVSVTAVMLALTIRIYRRYGSLDVDEISMKAKKEGNKWIL